MAAEHGESPTEYITHHLTHLKVGAGFWTFNVDTLVMSGSVAAVLALALWLAARRASTRAPTGFLGFVEFVYDWIDGQVSDIYHGDRRFLTGLAFTLFTWVVAMNSMDLLPVDLPGSVAALFGAKYWRVLPTSDLNGTIAMAIVVLFMVVIAGIRSKGIGGYLHEWAAAPFGIWLFPANIILNLVELLAKPVSLGMRLYAVSGWTFGSGMAFIGQIVMGAGWAIFHILIVLLQAYIFTVLPIVYITMAEEHH
jgi:F-type H+-transporting ATPase subunit a